MEILNLDSSASCIERMKKRYGDLQGLQWQVCDVTKLDLTETFDAVVEKGCLDALLCCSDQEAAKYVKGLATVLAPGAPCLIVSNSMARRRHLHEFFEVTTIPVDPEDQVFGPCVYICRRF